MGLIETNQYAPQEFIGKVKQYTQAIVEEIKNLELSYSKKVESLGTCPACQTGQIVIGKKVYDCNRWKEGCSFKWKPLTCTQDISTPICPDDKSIDILMFSHFKISIS